MVTALVVAIAVVVAVAVLIWLGGEDEQPEVVLPASIVTSTTTTAPPPTTTTTTAPTTAPTTAAPPPFDPGPTATGFADPFEAVADWAWGTGLNYQGDCAFLDSTADYGVDPWCGQLWDDRGSVEVYRVADFPGGDFRMWLLVAETENGWFVQEVAEDVTGVPPF